MKINNKINSIAEDNNISLGLTLKYYNILKSNESLTFKDEYYLLQCLYMLINLRKNEPNNSIDNLVKKTLTLKKN